MLEVILCFYSTKLIFPVRFVIDCSYVCLFPVMFHCTRMNPIADNDLLPLSGSQLPKFPQDILAK